MPYVIRSLETNLYFRNRRKRGGGLAWTSDLSKAKIFTDTGACLRSTVSVWVKNDPMQHNWYPGHYEMPEIYHLMEVQVLPMAR